MTPHAEHPGRDGARPGRWDAWQLTSVALLLVAANLSIALSQILLGVALAVMLGRRLVARTTLPVTGLEWPVLLLAFWALAVLPFSSDPVQSLVFYRRFFLFGAIWAGAAAARGEGSRRGLAGALLAGAVLISVYGQVNIWRETGSLFDVRLGEMSNPMTSGCLLMLVLLVVVGILLTPGIGARARWLLGLAALPVAVGLIQTMTRSAWLGLAAGSGLILLLRDRRWLAVYILGAVAVLVVVPRLAERNADERLAGRLTPGYVAEGQNTSRRLEMWRAGWQIIRDHPVTGIGDRDLTEVLPAYYGDQDTVYFGHLHSNLVMLAVIWGIPGFLLAMGFFLVTLVRPWRLWVQLGGTGPPREPWRRGWALGAAGAAAGFFTAGLTEWYFGDAESMLLFLTILGVALGTDRHSEDTGHA
ncbi:O-antigen ligase family protein [bacterium]|nr:O-antigen ligase family protein [bacterium]